MSKILKIRGHVYYAYTSRPDKYGKIGCKLVVDSATEALLIAEGLKPSFKRNGQAVSFPDHKGAVFSFSTNTKNPDGTDKSYTPIKVTDAAANPFSGLIGHGSVVNLYVAVFKGTKGAAKDVMLGMLQAIQVIELVEVEGSGDVGSSLVIEKEEGFISNGEVSNEEVESLFKTTA